jgi:hypothetical protein
LNGCRYFHFWDDWRALLNVCCRLGLDDRRALLNICSWPGYWDDRRDLLSLCRWLGFWDDWRDLLNICHGLGYWDDRKVLLNRFRRLGGRGLRDPSKKRGGCECCGDGWSHGCCHFEEGLLSGGPALRYAAPVPRSWRRLLRPKALEFRWQTAVGARASSRRLHFKCKLPIPAACT